MPPWRRPEIYYHIYYMTRITRALVRPTPGTLWMWNVKCMALSTTVNGTDIFAGSNSLELAHVFLPVYTAHNKDSNGNMKDLAYYLSGYFTSTKFPWYSHSEVNLLISVHSAAHVFTESCKTSRGNGAIAANIWRVCVGAATDHGGAKALAVTCRKIKAGEWGTEGMFPRWCVVFKQTLMFCVGLLIGLYLWLVLYCFYLYIRWFCGFWIPVISRNYDTSWPECQ